MQPYVQHIVAILQPQLSYSAARIHKYNNHIIYILFRSVLACSLLIRASRCMTISAWSHGVTRTAFSFWNDRIAPVFDVARNLRIVEATESRVTDQTGRRFSTDNAQGRALRLSTLQVEQLVCGAITRSSCDALTERSIQVVPFAAGKREQVIQAWLSGSIIDGHLAMPGCHRGKQHSADRQPRYPP